MPDLIVELLKELGPCVSGKLVEAIAGRHQLRLDAARQRLSRCKAIKRLAYIRFPKNARFVYLQADYGSPSFWGALAKALLDENSAYGAAIAALIARGGMIPISHFGIACGAPIAQKKHLSADSIREHLQRAGLVQIETVPGLGACVRLSDQMLPDPSHISRIRGRIHAEDVLLLTVRDWLRKLSMVSYDAVKVRSSDADGEQPRVGTFWWDLSGPSYLSALAGWSTSGDRRPGFVVCDVLLGRQIRPQDLRPFILKCESLRSLRNVASCLQVFVADGYTSEALQLAKERGIIPASPGALFGNEVAEALLQLESLLADAYVKSDRAEIIAEIFKKLSAIEGVATNLRGALFEYIVADLVKRSSVVNDVRLNEVFTDEQGRSAEVDVLAIKARSAVRVIECKGYKPGGQVPDVMVRRWLEDRIPLIRRAVTADSFFKREELIFEFWTSGTLSTEALEMIGLAQRKNSGKYSIQVVAQEELKAIAKEHGDKALRVTMEEHFFSHPLSVIDKNLAARSARKAAREEGQVRVESLS